MGLKPIEGSNPSLSASLEASLAEKRKQQNIAPVAQLDRAHGYEP